MKTTNRARRVTALALTFLAGIGITTIAAPAADAQTNRRICTYSGVETWYSSNGAVASYGQWALNYKKKGGCPTNGNAESLRNTATSTSWEKITCEEFGDRFRTPSDPCPGMTMDSLYYVRWYVNGSPSTFTNHGHY
ncbi:hypothetical protein JNUCC0626_47945 [Lentzea sp. JNUCC 0626]|uniref:hypothetical protein n=1 Tax=Lentzea sp. JNUCC 0626 TaxID=3367513 RepID=UPI003748F815